MVYIEWPDTYYRHLFNLQIFSKAPLKVSALIFKTLP
jgi:hypothetical protein